MTFINEINDILWTYILIIMLLGCAIWFSIRTRFVQFRMIREMIVLLSESAGKGKQGEKHVSSFQRLSGFVAVCRSKEREHCFEAAGLLWTSWSRGF